MLIKLSALLLSLGEHLLLNFDELIGVLSEILSGRCSFGISSRSSRIAGWSWSCFVWFKGAAKSHSSIVPTAPSMGDSRSYFLIIIPLDIFYPFCTYKDLLASLEELSMMRFRCERAAEFEKFLFLAVVLPNWLRWHGAFDRGFDKLFLFFAPSFMPIFLKNASALKTSWADDYRCLAP